MRPPCSPPRAWPWRRTRRPRRRGRKKARRRPRRGSRRRRPGRMRRPTSAGRWRRNGPRNAATSCVRPFCGSKPSAWRRRSGRRRRGPRWRRSSNALTDRLQTAVGFTASEAAVWRRVLTLLVGPASDGVWTREARLLYDLQRVCIDREREVFAVDLVEWFVSWGRRPVVRLLPHQRQVNLVRHLRASAHRAAAARLPEADRRQFLRLLHQAIADHEMRLRDRFRPLLLGALEESCLRPRGRAEQIARDKVIEELLDRVVDRGFLTIGDLRDALARNRLKLPDLSGPREFFLGDRADPRQPQAGRRAGRRLSPRRNLSTRAATTQFPRLRHAGRPLPHPLPAPAVRRRLPRARSRATRRPPRRPSDRSASRPAGGRRGDGRTIRAPAAPGPLLAATTYHAGLRAHRLELVNEYSLPLLGVFLLCLFHIPWFRRRVFGVLRLLWRVVRGVFYDLPVGVARLPAVRAVFQSRAYLAVYQYVLKPLIGGALVAITASLCGADCALVVGSARPRS